MQLKQKSMVEIEFYFFCSRSNKPCAPKCEKQCVGGGGVEWGGGLFTDDPGTQM
jgi:hypothetical protein